MGVLRARRALSKRIQLAGLRYGIGPEIDHPYRGHFVSGRAAPRASTPDAILLQMAASLH